MLPPLPFLLSSSALLLAINAQSTVPTPLVTVRVPVEINSDLRYLASVNMSTGLNPQFFKFALASNTGYTMVAGESCTSCGGVPSYNATASTTETGLTGRTQDVTFGPSTGSGAVIKENCGLFETNGSYWQYPNQTIVVANTSSAFSGSTSGIFGMGTNSNGDGENDFFDTIFGQWMKRNPTHNNFSFGLALNPAGGESNDGGIIHWVVPDTSFAEGQISFKDVQPTNSTPGIGTDNTSQNSNGISTVVPQGDWSVQLDSWAASVGASQISNSTPSTAIIEVFYPNIYFPLQQANLLYAAISGSELLPDLVDDFQVWSIPCDSQFSLAFNFGQVFSLDQSILMVQNGSTCTGVIQGFPDNSEQFFLFGSRFVSQLYIIFVVGRPGTSTPSQIGFGNRANTKKSKPIGAIVGGTVGGVVGLALVALGIFFFVRYRRRRSSTPSQNNTTLNQENKESKAQYITYTGSTMYGSSPSPPSTAGLYRPLLPEPQSPDAPQFNIPRATFASLAPAPTELQSTHSSGHVHPYQYVPQAPIVSNHQQSSLLISPQTSPLSHHFNHQEITNDQVYRNMHPLDSTIASPSGTGYTIEPFQMPSTPSQPESRLDSKSAIRTTNPSESDTNPPPPAYMPAEEAPSTTLIGSSSNAASQGQRPT